MWSISKNSKPPTQHDIFQLISSRKWRELKAIISNHKSPDSILNNICDHKTNKSDLNALQLACSFHPPLDVIQCIYNAYPRAIYERDHKGNCALHTACKSGCIPGVVRFLVEKYPQAATKTNLKGRSPFLLACKSYLSSHLTSCHHLKRIMRIVNEELLTVLQFLVTAAPICVTIKDYLGMGPLDYAIKANVDSFVIDYVRSVVINMQRQMGLVKKMYTLGSKSPEGSISTAVETNMKRAPRKAGANAA